MTVTAASFRVAFPVFASEKTYASSTIEFWSGVGVLMVNADRWGALTDLGVMLYTAHNITLELMAAKGGINGAPGGRATGPVTSKSVDKVSVAYAAQLAASDGAGQYNLTMYGQRYWQLLQMMGMGGLQSNTPGQGPGWNAFAGAYPGPLPGFW